MSQAVFLSYASQDGEAARRICDALRAAGVEVWFDQSELRGGDAWDAKIRKQIKECALFVPVISANTQARREGYFRIEWKLAAQRTHAIAEGTPFLLPVIIDDTREPEALVPAEFRDVQWTRLKPDVASGAFAGRVRNLLECAEVSAATAIRTTEMPRPKPRRVRRNWLGAAVVLGLGAIAFGVWKWRPAAPGPRGSLADIAAPSLARRAAEIVEDEEHYSRAALELAEQFCQQAIARDANDGEAHAVYARVHAALIYMSLDPTAERRAAAQKEMSLAERLAPDADEVLLARADFFKLSAETKAESEPLLRTVVARRPQHKYTLRWLAWTLRARARAFGDNTAAAAPLYEEAVALLRRADALPGGDSMALLFLAQHETSLGRGDEAERVLDEGLARHISPRLLRYKSDLRTARGDLTGASATVEKLPASTALEPGFAASLVQIRIWQRRPEEALRLLAACPVDYFEDLFFTGPKDYWTGLALSLQPKRQDAARVAWQQALRVVENRLAKQPGVAHLVRWRGVLLSHVGNPTEARQALELAKQLEDPILGINNVRLATSAWLRLGERERALQSIRSWRNGGRIAPSTVGWLRFDPELDALRGSPEFRELLAEFERRTGFVTAAVDSLADAKSVAVLAFDNLSDDKANEYFSDGISEELINMLGRVPGLVVRGRTSAFYFKGNTKVSSAEIAQKLGVAYLVRGSVRKSGNKVRITAQLTRAANDEVIWSSPPLTREVADVFTAQEEIAGLVAQSLQLKLGIQATPTRPTSAEALRLYLEGRQIWNLRTRQALDRAEALFNQALAFDPKFARARVGRADVWMQRYAEFSAPGENLARFANRRSPLVAKITAEAESALTEDPTLAEAHTTIGNALSLTWQDAAADEHFRRALSLNPNYATTHQWLGRLLLREGRMDEARTELAKAADLDPLSPIILDNYGMVLLCAGDAAAALPVIERALLFRPDSVQTLSWQAWALADLGRIDDAVAVARRLAQNPNAAFATPRTFLRAGMKEEAEAFVRRPDLATDELRWFAQLGIGRPAEALTYLRPEDVNSVEIHYLLFLPEFDPVRNDPRFQHVLKTLGVVEAHARAQAWHAAHPPAKPALKP